MNCKASNIRQSNAKEENRIMKAKKKPVQFEIQAGNVSQVYLAGSFNNWNPHEIALAPVNGDGLFRTTLKLPQGRYEYKFVVNDNWTIDPSAVESVPNGLGDQNSVIMVN